MKKYKKIYCFDLDGVICHTKGNLYTESKPIIKAIKKINQSVFRYKSQLLKTVILAF